MWKKKHPTFTGVALKYILSLKDANSNFCYHLVRIAPNKSIQNPMHATQLETDEVICGKGMCANDGVNLPYQCGTISIFPIGVPHEVNAGCAGLWEPPARKFALREEATP